MQRFDGTCEQFATADIASVVNWISAIPFEEWPQQSRLADDNLRPAMINDPMWFGFHQQVNALVNGLLDHFPVCVATNYMLSAVMPGHEIEPHTDERGQRSVCRVHVPLVSNPHAMFLIEDAGFNMQPGTAYKINTEREHAITNRGQTPRVHFMFDVRSGTS